MRNYIQYARTGNGYRYDMAQTFVVGRIILWIGLIDILRNRVGDFPPNQGATVPNRSHCITSHHDWVCGAAPLVEMNLAANFRSSPATWFRISLHQLVKPSNLAGCGLFMLGSWSPDSWTKVGYPMYVCRNSGSPWILHGDCAGRPVENLDIAASGRKVVMLIQWTDK